MVLVTGAAGKTGLSIINALGKDNWQIRALVHREEQINSVLDAGAAEVVTGDMRDRAVMREAMIGVRKAYHICPNVSPEELTIGKLALEAAAEYGLDHFVYHSVLRPQIEKMPHHWQKMRVEEAIFESGLPFTILQPAPYMQNVLAGWDELVSSGIYVVPYHESTRITLVDIHDVAQTARVVLASDDHIGAIYELCGPDALTQTEIAGIIGDAVGMSVICRSLDRNEWARQARARGLGTYQVETLLQMFDYYERFGFTGSASVLNAILGRPGTSFASYIEGLVQA